MNRRTVAPRVAMAARAAGPLFACGVVLLGGCGAEQEDPDGVQRVVLDQVEYPCELVFEPTGVVVESDSAGAYPDPMPGLSRSRDGRLYAYTRLGGEIVRFGPDGRYQRTIGRVGEGPGEMGNGVSARVAGDTLHVLDPALGRWNRFTLEGEFLSSGSSIHFRNMTPGNYEIVGRDSLLTSRSAANDGYQFHLVDSEGEVIRAFGALTGEPLPNRGTIALGSAATFWVAPYQGEGEYVLQEWSYEGRLLRRLERRVSWFERVLQGESELDESGRQRFPVIMHPFAGAEGQLLVVTFVSELDLTNGKLLEVWYEVIDPRTGTVLASRRLPGNEGSPPMFRVSAPGPLGTRATRDDNDLYRIELVRYALRPRVDTPEAVRTCTT